MVTAAGSEGRRNICLEFVRRSLESAAYGTTYSSNLHPHYYRSTRAREYCSRGYSNLKVLGDRCSVAVPSLFPETSKRAWLESVEFLLPGEKAKDAEIERTISDTSAVVEKLREQRADLGPCL